MEGALALFSLEGRTAIVTGAASGLGRAIAVGLGQAGASVVAADLAGSALEDVVEEIGGSRAIAIAADVTRRDDVEAMVREAAARTGCVDVLVNSAGIGARGAADEYPADLWERVLAVNLTGTFTCCQVAGQHMLGPGAGSIVNIASIGGLVGWAGSLGYQASKGGVVQLTRTLAVEWAARGVRVNAIAPCTFETARRRRASARPSRTSTPACSPGSRSVGSASPEEIVGPALFLASDAASMVTGHILTVDGGYTAQ